MGSFTVEDAVDVATRAHAGQVDKAGHPYIEHPLRVMARVSTEYERMTAVLHDLFEDTSVTPADLRRLGCPEPVIAAVEALTKRPGESLAASMTRAASNQLAFNVKLADIADNSDPERLSLLDPKEAVRLTAKYADSRRMLTQAQEELAHAETRSQEV